MRAGMKRFILASFIALLANISFADEVIVKKDVTVQQGDVVVKKEDVTTIKQDVIVKRHPFFKDCPPSCALHYGFFGGLQVGYDSFRLRQKITFASGVNSNPALNATGVVGGAFFGYGRPFYHNRFYLAGEVLVNGSNAGTSYTSTLAAPIGAYTGNFVVNSSYGGALLPGYYLSPFTLAYIRLGYTYAKMKYTETFAGVTAAKSKTSSGMNLGLGLETLLIGRYSGRLEYTHIFYNSFSTSTSTANNAVINPSDNQVMVALVYHLC